MKLWLTLLLILWFYFQVAGQLPFIKQSEVNSSLPTNCVYAAFSDIDGSMWFTTDMGVFKYDGFDLEHFTTDDGLPGTEIFGGFQDNSKRIWFRTLNGNVGYSMKGRFFNKSANQLLKKNNFESYISSIIEDGDNLFFSSINGELAKLNLKKNSSKRITDSLLIIYGLHLEGGTLFAFTSEGIQLYDKNSLELSSSLQLPQNKSYIRSVKKGHTIYFSTGYEIYKFSLQTRLITKFISSKSEIISLNEIDNELWVGTRDGAFKISTTSNQGGYQSILEGKSITSVSKDYEGGIWFTTLNNGIYYSPSANLASFFILNAAEQINNGISCLNVSDEGEIWIGCSKNRYGIEGDGKFEFHDLSESQENHVNRIRQFKRTTYVLSGGTIKVIESGKSPLFFPYSANDILKYQNGDVLIAANKLIRFSKDRFNKLLKPTEVKRISVWTEDVLYEKRVNVLCPDDSDKAFFGTNDGLYFLDGNSIKPILFQSNNLGVISDIHKCSNKVFIVSTLNNGIFLVKGKKIVQHITTAQGLGSSCCLKIAEGIDNQFWVLTSKGLYKIRSSNNSIHIENISANIGLSNQRIQDITFHNGRLLIATTHQIIQFEERKFVATIPKIRFLRVTAGNIEISDNQVLLPDQNDISISFSGITYKNQGGIFYQYRLVGSSNNWRQTTSRNIEFESLPAGEYIFELRAVNSSGIKSKTILFKFSIEKPFYQHLWFYGVCFFMIFASVALLWKVRINRVRKKYELNKKVLLAEKESAHLQKELKDIEQQALRLQMNPHFIFNALNTIKGFYTSEDIESASIYISKFSKLLRIILEHKESTITITEEIELLQLYIDLILLRYENKFLFEIKVDDEINPTETIIPSMLIQPFIENSIIHGIGTMMKEGILIVQFEKNANTIICTIRDNGVGREASAKKRHERTSRINAIDIVKRRLFLIQKGSGQSSKITINDLRDQDGASGTEVIITLPYSEKW